MNDLKKYLVIAEQVVYLEALIEADNEEEAAEAFLEGKHVRIKGEDDPEILEVREVK